VVISEVVDKRMNRRAALRNLNYTAIRIGKNSNIICLDRDFDF